MEDFSAISPCSVGGERDFFFGTAKKRDNSQKRKRLSIVCQEKILFPPSPPPLFSYSRRLIKVKVPKIIGSSFPPFPRKTWKKKKDFPFLCPRKRVGRRKVAPRDPFPSSFSCRKILLDKKSFFCCCSISLLFFRSFSKQESLASPRIRW